MSFLLSHILCAFLTFPEAAGVILDPSNTSTYHGLINASKSKTQPGLALGALPTNWKKIGPYVGHNDSPQSFDDYRKCQANGVTAVGGRGGKHLDQLVFKYRNQNGNCDQRGESHGGTGGAPQSTFNLEDGEIITEVFMSTGKGHFYSIQFKTSQGQLSPAYGGTSRNWNYKYQVPPGKEIKAFYGTYGNEIFGIGFYVGPTPTPAPACKASQITGKWEYLTTVGVPEDWTTFYGTTKTDSRTKTKEWDESVTTTLKQSWKLFGYKGSISISGMVAHSTADSYSEQFSTVESEQWTMHFNQANVGKSIWQFKFNTTDTCENVLNTGVKELAVTNHGTRQPCCVPRFSTDPPLYLTCVSKDAMIPGGETPPPGLGVPACRVRSPLVPDGT